jgi:hypothetical protein
VFVHHIQLHGFCLMCVDFKRKIMKSKNPPQSLFPSPFYLGPVGPFFFFSARSAKQVVGLISLPLLAAQQRSRGPRRQPAQPSIPFPLSFLLRSLTGGARLSAPPPTSSSGSAAPPWMVDGRYLPSSTAPPPSKPRNQIAMKLGPHSPPSIPSVPPIQSAPFDCNQCHGHWWS